MPRDQQRIHALGICDTSIHASCIDAALPPTIPVLSDVPEVLEMADGSVILDDGVLSWDEVSSNEDRHILVTSSVIMSPIPPGKKESAPWPAGLRSNATLAGFSFKAGPSLDQLCDKNKCRGMSVALEVSTDAVGVSSADERVCQSGNANDFKVARVWLAVPGQRVVRMSQNFCLEREDDEDGQRETRSLIGSPRVEVGASYGFLTLVGEEVYMWNGDDGYEENANMRFDTVKLTLEEVEVTSRFIGYVSSIDAQGILNFEAQFGQFLSRLYSLKVEAEMEEDMLHLNSDSALYGWLQPRDFYLFVTPTEMQ